jgi:hypothetical protein
MFHKGSRTSGGSLPNELMNPVNTLLDEFMDIVTQQAQIAKLKRAIVRAQLTCNMFIVLDKSSLHVGAEKASGMPSSIYIDHRTNLFSQQQVYDAAKWEFGYDKPFVISFPSTLLDQDKDKRHLSLSQIAVAYIESEVRRVEKEMNLIQINPIFGPASYEIDPRLAFVLMPFTDELTETYTTLIKPIVENNELGLVCKRADDIKSNRAIMQDIWKSICEARLIIADLTGLNPNVMYELGVAHTLGKETLIIYRKDENIKFPFDLAHIRRIEYENTPVGGTKLVSELRTTLQAILSPEKIGG